MSQVEIKTLKDKWIITVDKSVTDVETIDSFLKKLKIEELTRKADFDEEKLMQISDEIKKDWWDKNKKEFLKGIKIENCD